MTNTLELTKQLVSIPSWVGRGCDEQKVGQFIYDWLRENTKLKVIKQPVVDDRFNVIAADDSPTRLLLVGHIDTVESRAGWETDPFTPTLKGDRLYGLGATDMKGSLAAMLTAVSEAQATKGLMVLCYIDEEYDFAGMRAFVNEYKNQLKPDLVVSLDGYAETFGFACRGLIEVSFQLRGKSGHAGRPELGNNAITQGVNCVSKLKRQLATKYSDRELGTSSLNLAYCQGGLDKSEGVYGRQGNNIPDLAEFVLDIRPASTLLTAGKVLELLSQYSKAAKLTIENWSVRHDLGSWLTQPDKLRAVLPVSGNYEPFQGYVDTQMLWQSWDGVPCVAIGASSLGCAHSPNEFVEQSSLEKTRDNVSQLINQFAK